VKKMASASIFELHLLLCSKQHYRGKNVYLAVNKLLVFYSCLYSRLINLNSAGL
jgi:hypothetical protein